MGKFGKGNPGRPKGAKNKSTDAVRKFAVAFVEDKQGLDAMRNLYRRGKLHPAVVQMLFHYAYGKPKETVALENPAELLIPVLRTKADVRAVLGEPDDDAGGDDDD